MYSAESVHSRFAAHPPHSSNADHSICVVYSGGWKYDTNSALYTFTPRSTDILVAAVNFSGDTVSSLEGQDSTLYGIAYGYASGDLTFEANKWNGVYNYGEFSISGTTLTPNDSWAITTKYYYAAGARVAMNRDGVVYYLHADHLGSTSLATNDSGGVVAEQWYYPCGEERWASGTLPTDRRFTGQRWEQGLGLYDYNARWYHPALGRFVSADTVVPEPGNPQSLNRFAYVANNPLKYVDPSGHSWLSDLVRNVEAGITNLGIAIGQSGPVGEALMIHAAEMTDPLKSIADAERNPSMASVHSSFWEGAEGWDGAFDSMGEVGIYTVSAIAEGRWEDASRGASGLAQMEGTLAQVPVKVAYQLAKGVVTFPAQVCEDAWEFGSAAREAYGGERGGWDVVWHATMLAGDVYAVYSVGAGREYKSDLDHRIAPSGNRTGHPTGELSHSHRRVTTPSGETVPGQGTDRHRPWEPKSTDVSFWDRC